jgi:hypothetical protein
VFSSAKQQLGGKAAGRARLAGMHGATRQRQEIPHAGDSAAGVGAGASLLIHLTLGLKADTFGLKEATLEFITEGSGGIGAYCGTLLLLYYLR